MMNRLLFITTVWLSVLCISEKTTAQTVVDLSASDYPVLHIHTVDSQMPQADMIEPPEGQPGVSITNNSYVAGRMVMTVSNDTVYDSGSWEKNVSGMKIKRRGNSTGAYLDQHPYKIKLTQPYDLLFRDDSIFAHKEWVLLSMYTWNVKMKNSESNILTVLGLILGKLLGQPWTPHYSFVHVVLNGQYQGMYYLIEPVSRGEGRINTEKSGFIMEHDIFWWNEDKYIHTWYDSKSCAFTYKYPKSDNVTAEQENSIKAYLDECERAIFTDGENPFEKIDVESFARFLLLHDLLGTDDSGGANRFLVRRDSLSALLEMGPAWDFDSSFRSSLDYSLLRDYTDFYYPRLLTLPAFVTAYNTIWQNMADEIQWKLNEELDSFWTKYGSTFDYNMQLHQQLYPYEGRNTLKEQVDEIKEKMAQRISTVDRLVNDNITVYPALHANKENSNHITDLQGRCYHIEQTSLLPSGIYIRNGKKLIVK